MLSHPAWINLEFYSWLLRFLCFKKFQQWKNISWAHNITFQSLEEQLAKLTADFEKATTEKLLCQKEADATNATIQLANRLVGGLASENVRWAEAVNKYIPETNASSV